MQVTDRSQNKIHMKRRSSIQKKYRLQKSLRKTTILDFLVNTTNATRPINTSHHQQSDIPSQSPPTASSTNKKRSVEPTHVDFGSSYIEDDIMFNNSLGCGESDQADSHDHKTIEGMGMERGEFMSLLISLVYVLNLSRRGLGIFLKFLELLNSDLGFVRSKYYWDKYWQKFLVPLEKHFFCRECSRFSKEKKCIHCAEQCEFLLHCSITEQLKKFLTNEAMCRDMSYYRTQYVSDPTRIQDLYDGSVYRTLGHPISNSSHGYTLTMNWDGVNRCKSSNKSAWPIFLSINELHRSKRTRPENVIFAGMWYGRNKPDSNILFSMLVKELQQLELGVPCTDYAGNSILLRCRLINSALDIPAKADAFHLKHHGGHHACSYCLNKGISLDRKVYYPIGHSLSAALRSDEFWDNAYSSPATVDSEYFGVVGRSILKNLSYWSPRCCQSIDAMHLIHGVQKKLLKVWQSDSIISAKKWVQFDRIYTQQKIHGVFKRPVRSLLDHGNYYNCSESLVFCLYLSPLLRSYLPQRHFEHHMLLVESLGKLFRDSITTVELQAVSILFHELQLTVN